MKPKKCKNCKKEFKPVRSFQQACSLSCAIEISKSKEAKKRDKEQRKAKKEGLEALKTIPQLKKEARAEFQKWVRKRDENKPCISCGKTSAIQWDGGHYLKAEIYSGLIFDERNCHKQCSHCNDYLAGNVIEYRKGLISRYGMEYVNQLESEADSNRVRKYSKQELRDIKELYRQKIKKN